MKPGKVLAFDTSQRDGLMNTIVNPEAGLIQFTIGENENFPGSRLPVVVYKNAVELPGEPHMAALDTQKLLMKNNWTNNWIDSIFEFDHFHSITHEVLCINFGNVIVMLGGPGGRRESLETGDIIIIPAGVAHKKIASSNDFSCVGGYPDGKEYDIQKGDAALAGMQENISAVPLPLTDPVFGKNGHLLSIWK